MYMRLGFAIAAHLDVDVLLLDEVFAVGDEEFQRKCFGKIFEFKQRGGTIVFVSHDARRHDRLCAGRAPRTARSPSMARRARRSRSTTACWPRRAIQTSAAPASASTAPARRGSRSAGWSAGRRRIEQFSPGEQLTVHVRIDAAEDVPPNLSWELRDEAGLVLAAGSTGTADIGWKAGQPDQRFRFDVESLPLGDGRFRLRLELTDEAGGRLYHWLDDAARFVVYPSDGETGLVRIDGRWSADAEAAGRTDT